MFFLVELGSQIFQNILYTLVHVFIIMHNNEHMDKSVQYILENLTA